MLRQTAAYQHSTIRRSRDAAVLDTLPIIVDVGAVYDPSRHRYDHHQRGFTETLSPEHSIKLSSAGLVYKHFGEEIVRRLTGCTDEAELRVLWLRQYRTFVEALDAIDNGIAQYDTPAKPLYRSSTDLSSRVGHLNGAQSWDASTHNETQDQRFERASQLTGREFTEALMFSYHQWLPARRVVRAALERRFDVHSSGVIVRFDDLVVWKSHISALEEEMQLSPQLLYVLYEDERKKWRVQCVPAAEDSFASRKALPEAWRGVRDEALSTLTGIPGCIFVHASGFIGGAETYEGALAMAVASYEMPGQAEGGGKKQKVDEMKM